MHYFEKPNLHVLIRSGCFCGGVATNSSALSLLNTKSVCLVSITKALFSLFTDLITELAGSKSVAEWTFFTEYQHESSIFPLHFHLQKWKSEHHELYLHH